MLSKFKQVIVLRSDLKMSPGKAAAQASHAAVSSSEEARKTYPSWWREWMESGQCKIVLKVNSEAELLNLEKKAKELGLPTALISDMGLTELEPGTITALGIGPAPSDIVDKITGSLPLY
ncbi:MAG: peptidyl-tRNA hydrolase Pth2 [Candidatus Bathyarchaeia archaeon]